MPSSTDSIEGKCGPAWRLEMLGELKLLRYGSSVPLPGTRKAHLMLAYLAYHLSKTQSREELIDIFWAESSLEAGRNSLNNALSLIRSVLEPGSEDHDCVLASTRATVGLRAETFSTDIAELEEARKSAHACTDTHECGLHREHILKLYVGDFLPGCYEDWALTARSHFEAIYQEAVLSQVRALTEAGDLDRAVYCAEEAARRSPDWEHAHLELIRLYDLKGLPSIALRHFSELERILADLDDVPSPDLREWAQHARQKSFTISPLAAPPAFPIPTTSVTTSTDASLTDASFRLGGLLYGRNLEINTLTSLLKSAFSPHKRDLSSTQERLSQSSESSTGILITLTGPAGVGKTRLAEEVVAKLKQEMDVQSAFIPLASLSDASFIPSAIAKSLGTEGGTDPLNQVIQRLSSYSGLVVLDNLEHLLPKGRETLKILREHLPAISWLITSRQRLAISGEQEVFIGPLAVPPQETTDLASLWQCPSVCMFVAEARIARPQFMLAAENALDVAGLCRRLDGLPFALKMVAAWARVLTPSQMLARLAHRLDLLVSRHQEGDNRHSSLEAALEWGWRLLAPAVQTFLGDLTVFQGGWTMDAAEAICQEPLALKYLTQLQEQSWVVVEEISGALRFQLLTTIHDYLSSRNTDGGRFDEEWHSSERWKLLRTRHAAYFLDVATQNGPARNVPVQDEWLVRLSVEQDNLRAALDWCLKRDNPLGLRLAVELHGFWKSRGLYEEGMQYLLTFLQDQSVVTSTILLSQAFNAAGSISLEKGDFAAAQEHFAKAQHFAYQSDDQEAGMRASGNLGRVLIRLGQYDQAEHLILEQSEFFVSRGDRLSEMAASQDLGLIKLYQGHHAEAQTLLARAARLAEEFGDHNCLANALTNQGLAAYLQANQEIARPLLEKALSVYGEQREQSTGRLCALDLLGTIEMEAGHYNAARSLYEQVISASRNTGNRFSLAASTGNLGFVTLHQGLLKESAAAFHESLMLCRAMSELRITASVFGGVSQLALAQEKALSAAHLFGAMQALRRMLGMPISPSEQQEMDQLEEGIRDHLGEESFVKEIAVGNNLPWEEAVDYALSALLSG